MYRVQGCRNLIYSAAQEKMFCKRTVCVGHFKSLLVHVLLCMVWGLGLELCDELYFISLHVLRTFTFDNISTKSFWIQMYRNMHLYQKHSLYEVLFLVRACLCIAFFLCYWINEFLIMTLLSLFICYFQNLFRANYLVSFNINSVDLLVYHTLH